MNFSENGKRLLAEWEGKKSKQYPDVAGKPTIGVGHLLTQSELSSGKIRINGQDVRYENGLTDEQIINLLGADIGKFEQAVNENVKVSLNQNQFDALVIFAFNIGVEAFKGSTLLKLLNQKKYEEVPNQLRRWVHSGGAEVSGLKNRREKEIKLWLASL
jgi:lysozyme